MNTNKKKKRRTILYRRIQSERGHDFDYEPAGGFSDKWGAGDLYLHSGLTHPNDSELEMCAEYIANRVGLGLRVNGKTYQLFYRLKVNEESPVVFREIKNCKNVTIDEIVVRYANDLERDFVKKACLQNKFKRGDLFDILLPVGYFQQILEARYVQKHNRHSPAYETLMKSI